MTSGEDIGIPSDGADADKLDQLLRGMQANKPSPVVARVIVQEAELWARRLSLMRARRIRLVRWHAIRSSATV